MGFAREVADRTKEFLKHVLDPAHIDITEQAGRVFRAGFGQPLRGPV
jgi:hypothetical protein